MHARSPKTALGMAPGMALAVMVLFSTSVLEAQAMGARPPGSGQGAEEKGLPEFAAEHYITIRGRAEIRVEPTDIRVVFAIVTQGESPKVCRESNLTKEKAFLEALTKAGFGQDAVTVDFISMLPVYEWDIQERAGKRVAIEKCVRYLMQTNVHVRASSEAQSRKAVAEAFGLEIPDVIAFDYWCGDLDKYKVEARQKALAEAKRKADLLLSVFDAKPLPINVTEKTQTEFPAQLYRSFENTYSQTFQQYWKEQIPRISAFRPKNYYYAGFFGPADVADATLPMRPQISVVSTVEIYYRSPAQVEILAAKMKRKKEK